MCLKIASSASILTENNLEHTKNRVQMYAKKRNSLKITISNSNSNTNVADVVFTY